MTEETPRKTIEELRQIFDLTGKVAVVTGAGGTLGHALCRGLAAFGADIAGWDIKTEIMQDMVAEVQSIGRKATATAVDVTNEDSVKAAMDKVIEDFGKVNIMVTTAGTAGNRQPAETFDINEWQKVMDVNVRGTFLCAKHAGAQYIKQGGGGKIITIGSVRGFLGHPGGYAAYGTSKGAVHLLTKQLATEWAKYKINVNCIAPSIFWTPLTEQVRRDPEMVKIFMARIPMGRAAELDDFIGAVVYLASPASDYVTGVILSVDGGAVAG
ncbi:MAG: SDR family oxidoreductase [Thermoleophilia bacterium]|nr:SDR family oxidoreductase [Thermoleophilia bacterium]